MGPPGHRKGRKMARLRGPLRAKTVKSRFMESNQLSNPTWCRYITSQVTLLLTTTVPRYPIFAWHFGVFFPGVHGAFFAFLHWPSRSLHGAQSLVLVSLICMA